MLHDGEFSCKERERAKMAPALEIQAFFKLMAVNSDTCIRQHLLASR